MKWWRQKYQKEKPKHLTLADVVELRRQFALECYNGVLEKVRKNDYRLEYGGKLLVDYSTSATSYKGGKLAEVIGDVRDDVIDLFAQDGITATHKNYSGFLFNVNELEKLL